MSESQRLKEAMLKKREDALDASLGRVGIRRIKDPEVKDRMEESAARIAAERRVAKEREWAAAVSAPGWRVSVNYAYNVPAAMFAADDEYREIKVLQRNLRKDSR